MDLQYGRLTIRDALPADAPQLVRWWNDGAVMAHAGFPLGLGTTVEKEAARLPAPGRLMLEYDDRPIGEMNWRDVGSAAEIGIKICDATMQERGLGRIALSLLIRELFSMGFQKIILDTNLNNTRAQHVYEKLGFQKVAVRQNSWADQLGNLQSAVDYELNSENFVDFTQKPL